MRMMVLKRHSGMNKQFFLHRFNSKIIWLDDPFIIMIIIINSHDK